MAIIDVDI